MSERRPFGTKGIVSQKAAAVQIFQEMEEGKWLSADELTARITEITEAECLDSYGPCRAAAEHLAADHEGAWLYYMGGWKRGRPDEQYSDTVRRGVKHRRGQRRLNVWQSNALAEERIDGPERHRLQEQHRTLLAQMELEQRRANRRRPLAPSQSQAEITSD